MPLKLVGKALFKVRMGPMGTECTCWGGTLVQVCGILGAEMWVRNSALCVPTAEDELK